MHCEYSDITGLNSRLIPIITGNTALAHIVKLCLFQVYTFLNKLTGTQIGFTAMKMFVVDRPTILTVLNLMITYVFELYRCPNLHEANLRFHNKLPFVFMKHFQMDWENAYI